MNWVSNWSEVSTYWSKWSKTNFFAWLCSNESWIRAIWINDKNINVYKTRNLKVDGCQSNLYVKFYDFFCRRHFLMNRSCYNNLFKIMQHDNFRNLSRVIFIHWKYLESLGNTFWYCFPLIKQYTFHYLMASIPVFFKYCNCLIYGVVKV